MMEKRLFFEGLFALVFFFLVLQGYNSITTQMEAMRESLLGKVDQLNDQVTRLMKVQLKSQPDKYIDPNTLPKRPKDEKYVYTNVGPFRNGITAQVHVFLCLFTFTN